MRFAPDIHDDIIDIDIDIDDIHDDGDVGADNLHDGHDLDGGDEEKENYCKLSDRSSLRHGAWILVVELSVGIIAN